MDRVGGMRDRKDGGQVGGYVRGGPGILKYCMCGAAPYFVCACVRAHVCGGEGGLTP